MVVALFINDEQLKLFPGENITVNSSVLDIQDIEENTTDYTKTFTVPASDSNNKLFKHYYDADIDNSFDARISVDGRIDLDGMLFRKGKFLLSKVSVKKGRPSAYTINFSGSLVDLKDILGKDELSDLKALDVFDHSFDSDNVKQGLTTSLFGGDVVYNLFVKKQLYYSSDTSDTTITDTFINIGWGNGSGSNGVVWNDLKPSIRIIKIIEAIETEYPDIVFSRDFFGRAEFTDLFVWLNNSADNDGGLNSQIIDFDGGDTTYMNLTTNIGKYPDNGGNLLTWWILCIITPEAGYEDVKYTITAFVDGSAVTVTNHIGEGTNQSFFESADSLHYEVSSEQEFKYTTLLGQTNLKATISVSTTATSNTITSNFITSQNIPRIRTIDFLKGLFKMFKLVVIPQNDGTLFVNTLKSYYAEGGIFDITNYVDFEEYDVSRGVILNEINFLFEDPSTLLNLAFEENTRIAYGNQETKLADENGKILDGDTLEFTVPFEQIVYERLSDIDDNNITNIQYGAIIDENLSPVNPKMHLFYNIVQEIGSKTIGFIDDTGSKENITSTINTPSHTIGFDISNFSTIFDSEFSTWDGAKINNTLYTNYHEDYILSIFNIKKRSFRYTAHLPLGVLLKLELNDVLQIKDNYFRIDNFNSDLVTGKVELNLVNSFDNVINGFSADPTQFFIDGNAQQVSTYVTNLGNFSFNKVDNGSGVDWVTVTNDINNVFFDVDQNSTGVTRDIFIDLTSLTTLQEIRIYINQLGATITSDSDSITSDSDEITSDNG